MLLVTVGVFDHSSHLWPFLDFEGLLALEGLAWDLAPSPFWDVEGPAGEMGTYGASRGPGPTSWPALTASGKGPGMLLSAICNILRSLISPQNGVRTLLSNSRSSKW